MEGSGLDAKPHENPVDGFAGSATRTSFPTAHESASAFPAAEFDDDPPAGPETTPAHPTRNPLKNKQATKIFR